LANRRVNDSSIASYWRLGFGVANVGVNPEGTIVVAIPSPGLTYL